MDEPRLRPETGSGDPLGNFPCKATGSDELAAAGLGELAAGDADPSTGPGTTDGTMLPITRAAPSLNL